MKTLINWKIFFVLLIATVVATLLVLPYSLGMQSPAIDLTSLGIPLPVLIAIQTLQNAIIGAVMIFGGLFFAKRVGLTMPILDSLVSGDPVAHKVRNILLPGIMIGVAATVVMLALEFFYFQPAMQKELGDAADALNLRTGQPAAWKGFLASFYGGIVEEIQLRLFVMSLLAWLGSFISKTFEGKPTRVIFWIANILAAVLFGLGHLPLVSMHVPLTTLVVARTVVLNGIGGVVFGWLFWKRGLESAMIAHFSADLVLHVLLAL